MHNQGTNDHGIISVFVNSLTVVSEVVHTYGLINKCVLYYTVLQVGHFAYISF